MAVTCTSRLLPHAQQPWCTGMPCRPQDSAAEGSTGVPCRPAQLRWPGRTWRRGQEAMASVREDGDEQADLSEGLG